MFHALTYLSARSLRTRVPHVCSSLHACRSLRTRSFYSFRFSPELCLHVRIALYAARRVLTNI
jgi:hypothetical protein